MRRAEARAEDTEERRASRGQVRGHVKGNQRPGQRRQKDRGENETEGRNKLSTWFVDKQKPGRREGWGHKISKGRAEGSIGIRQDRVQEGQGDGDAWVSLSGGQDRDKGE